MLRVLTPSVFVAASAQSGIAASLSKSTYAMSYPFAYKDFMETHFPTAEYIVQANSTDTCVEWVKLCIDDGHMVACNGPSSNFQMHSVGAYMRESGNKSMEELEVDFTRAFGAMDKYDPYFEYHFAFYTADLDTYISDFKSAGVPHFASTFTDPATKKQYSSVLVQVPGSLNSAAKSLLAIELLGNSSVLVAQADVHRHDLPRASSTGLARAASRLAMAPRMYGSNGKPVLTPVHISFASSDLDRDVKYFEDVLSGTKVFDGSAAGGRVYTGVVKSGDATEVRYMQPSSLTTQGPISVADWEKYQVDLHNTCFDSADNQGFDRLADNHFGHSLSGADLTPYINAQKAAGLPYRFYAGIKKGTSAFFYLYGPNGWGVQLIGTCTDCTTTSGYDFCTQGITGHCNKDLSGSSIVV